MHSFILFYSLTTTYNLLNQTNMHRMIPALLVTMFLMTGIFLMGRKPNISPNQEKPNMPKEAKLAEEKTVPPKV